MFHEGNRTFKFLTLTLLASICFKSAYPAIGIISYGIKSDFKRATKIRKVHIASKSVWQRIVMQVEESDSILPGSILSLISW